MTAAALKTAPVVLRNAAGEPPLGADGEAFRADQGEILTHHNPAYQSPATRIGVLELANGQWLSFPFGVDRQPYDSREAALRAGIAAMVRKARRYMRNQEGQGTHWTEGYAGRVIEWALSIKPEKQGLVQVASVVDVAPIDHPGTIAADTDARMIDDTGSGCSGGLNQNISSDAGVHLREGNDAANGSAPQPTELEPQNTREDRPARPDPLPPSDPIVAELVAAHRARLDYPAGHTFAMTNPIVNGRMVTLGTCSCGDSFSYTYGSYERMDAAIEAHWQKFDHLPEKVDGRGNSINAEEGSDGSKQGHHSPARKRSRRSAPKTGDNLGLANAALPEPASVTPRVEGAGSPSDKAEDDDAFIRRQHQALADVKEGRSIDGEMFENLRGLKHVVGKGVLKLTPSGKDRLAELDDYFDRLMKLNMLPTAIDDLIALYGLHLKKLNDFVLARDQAAAELEGETLQLLQERANNNTTFGMSCDDSPAERLRAETAAPIGEAPGWWQRGVFRLVVDDIPHLVVHDEDAHVSVYAEDPDKPFLSETGFRSFLRGYIDDFWLGHTVAQQVERCIRESMKWESDGSGKPKLRSKPMSKPSSWHRLPAEGEGFEPVHVGDDARVEPAHAKKPRSKKSKPGAGGNLAPSASALLPGPGDGADALNQAAPIGAGTDEYLAGIVARNEVSGPSKQDLTSPGSEVGSPREGELRGGSLATDPFWDSPLIKAAIELAWKDPEPPIRKPKAPVQLPDGRVVGPDEFVREQVKQKLADDPPYAGPLFGPPPLTDMTEAAVD